MENMPTTRSIHNAGPSKLPVIKMRPKPPRGKKAKAKAKATPLVSEAPPNNTADSGLFTPPEETQEAARQTLISPPPEDTLRLPLRPSLVTRLASEEPPFSLNSDSTFFGSPKPDSYKRKRNTSTVSPAPEPSVEVTPNPKPRKQSRRQSNSRSVSPTRASTHHDEHTTPTRISPSKNRVLMSPHVENPSADYIPPVPSHTRRFVAAHSSRRSATPVPYEPPTERFTSPEVVLLSAPPSQARPKRRSPRPGAKRLTMEIKREPPLDIDLSVPLPPPSPTDDPLLLLSTTPRAPEPSALSRESVRARTRSPAPSPPREAPRFLSDSPPDAPPRVRSSSSSPGELVPARQYTHSPPSSDSDSMELEMGAPAFVLNAKDGDNADAWSDVEDSPAITQGKPEGLGEDEFTGKFLLLKVPTKADPPSSEEKERMDRWGRPISPFPGGPVQRKHSWVQELEDEQAGAKHTQVEGEGTSDPVTPAVTEDTDPRFNFEGLQGLEQSPALHDDARGDVSIVHHDQSEDLPHPQDEQLEDPPQTHNEEPEDPLPAHDDLPDSSFSSYDEPLHDGDASVDLDLPSEVSVDPFDFDNAGTRPSGVVEDDHEARNKSMTPEGPIVAPGTDDQSAAPIAPINAAATGLDVNEDADETEDEGVSAEFDALNSAITKRYSLAYAAIQRAQSEGAQEDVSSQGHATDERTTADESFDDEEPVVGSGSPQHTAEASPFQAASQRARSVEDEEEEDALYVDRALSREPESDSDEPLCEPSAGKRRSSSRMSAPPRANIDAALSREPESDLFEAPLRSSGGSRRSSPRRSASRQVTIAHSPEPKTSPREDSFDDLYAPGHSTVVRHSHDDVGLEAELDVDAAPAFSDLQDRFSALEDSEPMDVTVGQGVEYSDSDSDDDVDPNLVTITSEDPKAAARAAAILKMYDYDCLPQVLARRRRGSHATLDTLLRGARRRGVSTGGIGKRSRAFSVGGAVGDKVLIPGSPAMTLPELLREAEVELEHDPSIIEISPIKATFALPDAPMRASSNPLMTPHRSPVPPPPEFLQETPMAADYRMPREWSKGDWKAMDTCFTDERLDTGHRLGLPEDELADVDDINLDDVVDRFTNTLFGNSCTWDRQMLLTRARVLAKKQRSGKVAPPTPSGSRHTSESPFPTMYAPDLTPVNVHLRADGIDRQANSALPSAFRFTEKAKLPATLLAPRYSHLMDEAIAISNSHRSPAVDHVEEDEQPDPDPDPDGAPNEEIYDDRATPAPDPAPIQPPESIGKRVKGFLFSYLRSPAPKPAALPKVTLKPVSNVAVPLPPKEVVEKPRGPIYTPVREELPRPPPHKDLVDLQHLPTPAVKVKAARKPQRIVELRPVSPPPPPIQIPRPRKDSGGSVKDLVRSFEDMDGHIAMESAARKRSEQMSKVRNVGRLRAVSGGSKPVWKP